MTRGCLARAAAVAARASVVPVTLRISRIRARGARFRAQTSYIREHSAVEIGVQFPVGKIKYQPDSTPAVTPATSVPDSIMVSMPRCQSVTSNDVNYNFFGSGLISYIHYELGRTTIFYHLLQEARAVVKMVEAEEIIELAKEF